MGKYMYSRKDVCEKLGISEYTLDTWYLWESRSLKNGDVSAHYLPVPVKDKSLKGCPRRWSLEMIIDLKDYQNKIVRGRNGIYGKYTNPACH